MQVSKRKTVAIIFIAASIGFVVFSNIGERPGWFKSGIFPFQLEDGLAEGEVTTSKLADLAVTSDKIAYTVLDDINEGKIAYDTIEAGVTPDNSTFTPGVGTHVVAGDREAGDFTEVQNAIDALPRDGGVVYVREGFYELSGKIEIRSSNVSLIGAGFGTVMKQRDDDPVIHVGWGAENVLVANLRVIGSGGNPGIYFTGVTGSEIRNIRVENSEFGVYLKGSDRNFVVNNMAISNKDGIKLHDSHNNLVSGNFLLGNEGHGIYVLSSDRNAVSSNISRKNGRDGIRARSCSNNSIMMNLCSANDGAGIYLGYSDTANNLLTSNNLSGNGVGIRLTSSAESSKLVANHFSSNLNSGLQDESDTTMYIETNDIGEGAVTAPKIARNAINADKISPNAVSSAEIKDYTIKNIDLDRGIIEESNLLDGSVTVSKIEDNAIAPEKVRTGAINARHISDGSVGSDEIAEAAVTVDETSSDVLQSGTEEGIIDLSRKTGSTSVSFPFDFSSKPNVVVSFANVDDRTALPGSLFVENLTPEGFNVGWVLSQGGTGTADIVWYASLEPKEGRIGTQMLTNSSFEEPGEEGKKPRYWSFPLIYTEKENLSIVENELVQYKDYYGVEPLEGDYMARLRFASTSENCWAGLGIRQSFQNLDERTTSFLQYNVVFLYWEGADQADFGGAVVEVELQSKGRTYKLRYIHGYKRKVWPRCAPRTKYVDVEEGGKMPWQEWISVERSDYLEPSPLSVDLSF